MSPATRLLTVADIRERLSIGETLARELVGRPGGIKAIRLGRVLRVREDDLLAWLDSHAEGGR